MIPVQAFGSFHGSMLIVSFVSIIGYTILY